MEIKPGKFVVLTYDLYAGAGEPEETLMMRATDAENLTTKPYSKEIPCR